MVREGLRSLWGMWVVVLFMILLCLVVLSVIEERSFKFFLVLMVFGDFIVDVGMNMYYFMIVRSNFVLYGCGY